MTRSIVLFASLGSACIGGALLAAAGIEYVVGNPGPAIILAPLACLFFGGALYGGIKLNT